MTLLATPSATKPAISRSRGVSRSSMGLAFAAGFGAAAWRNNRSISGKAWRDTQTPPLSTTSTIRASSAGSSVAAQLPATPSDKAATSTATENSVRASSTRARRASCASSPSAPRVVCSGLRVSTTHKLKRPRSASPSASARRAQVAAWSPGPRCSRNRERQSSRKRRSSLTRRIIYTLIGALGAVPRPRRPEPAAQAAATPAT